MKTLSGFVTCTLMPRVGFVASKFKQLKPLITVVVIAVFGTVDNIHILLTLSVSIVIGFHFVDNPSYPK